MGSNRGGLPLTVKELERAKALSALGKSYRQIGRELQRSDKTVKRALTKTPEVITEVQELKKDIAALYNDLAERILESIDDKTIKEARLRDRVISAGVCTDKARLLNGESTTNLSIFARTIAEAHKSLNIEDLADDFLVKDDALLTKQGGEGE